MKPRTVPPCAPGRTAARRYWRRRSRRSRCRGRSQHALGARQLGPLEANGLAQAAAHALEAGLDHMMRILAAHAKVQRRSQRFRERAKEMRHQLRGHVADTLAVEAAFPHEM